MFFQVSRLLNLLINVIILRKLLRDEKLLSENDVVRQLLNRAVLEDSNK